MDNDVSTFSTDLAAGYDIDAPEPEGTTPLHIAARRQKVEFAKALLDKGVGVDLINVWGNTPLWVAVMERRRISPDGSMIRLLLEHGADPNRSENDSSLLQSAKIVAGFPVDLIGLLEEHAALS